MGVTIEPVKVYWILYARDPVKEEGLTMIERNTAYGSTCVKDESKGAGVYKMTLAALKTKPISIQSKDGTLSATCTINGQEEELLHIYVQNTTSWGMPKVEYVDVTGRKADGTLVTERIKP